MKVKWTKEIPAKEGWYWMKYRGKNGTVICPCDVSHFKGGGVLVRSARNDSFMAGPNHGGPELKYDGKVAKDVRFGPEIERPDELLTWEECTPSKCRTARSGLVPTPNRSRRSIWSRRAPRSRSCPATPRSSSTAAGPSTGVRSGESQPRKPRKSPKNRCVPITRRK